MIWRVTAEDEKEGISLEDDLAARLQAPAKTLKASTDPENRPAKQPSEPTRTDKFSMTGVGPPYQLKHIPSMSGPALMSTVCMPPVSPGCLRAKLPVKGTIGSLCGLSCGMKTS